nr:efflux transporter outer membrane subunit [Comamonas koreensis]
MKWLALSIWVTGAAVLLSGCAGAPVGPNYEKADPWSAGHATSAGAFQSSAGVASSEPLPPHWWRLYQDPLLDSLVQQALDHNTDLRQALAILERDQALEAEAHGAEMPSLSVAGGPGFGHTSGLALLKNDYQPPSRFTYSAGVTLSYQLDMFGQIRRAIEVAQAGTDAAQAAVDLVRVNVAASTARAYVQICSSGLRLRSAHASVQLQERAVNLSDRMQKAGKVAALDGVRARAQLEQLRAALPSLKAQRQAALYQLATLMGKAPRDFPVAVANCEQPPHILSQIPVGDGAALLRRRPDVRQAERLLAVATAGIGVATADLYPHISLGIAATSAGFATRMANRETFSYSLGPLISWTLPNTGIARARIAQAEAKTQAAVARFDGTVLTALREVETALDAYAQALSKNAALTAARDKSALAAMQARVLYERGKTAQLESLDAERSLAASEAALAASQEELAADQIVVFLALGGGWESRDEYAPAKP